MDAWIKASHPPRKPPAMSAWLDRWIYVLTAGLFLAAALVGFVPDSFAQIAAVHSGARPPFPPILHVHAIVMGLWIVLLLVQDLAVATDRVALHRRLGLAAAVLVPAVVIAAAVLVQTRLHGMAAAILHMPPDQAAPLRGGLVAALDVVLVQIASISRFTLLSLLGLWARTRDRGLHKRLMILATVTPIGAATNRIAWLASTMPDSPLSIFLWPLALLVPLLVWDIHRSGRVHGAYLIFAVLTAATMIPVLWLWHSPGWHRFVAAWAGLPGGAILL